MTKYCPLCQKSKDIKEFTDSKLYHEHSVCIKCCDKASKRLAMLTDYDIELCNLLKLNYATLTPIKEDCLMVLYTQKISKRKGVIKDDRFKETY